MVLLCLFVACSARLKEIWSVQSPQKRISELEEIIDSAEEARNHLRRSTSRLQKGRLADITLNILGLLVDLELRLGYFGIFVLAIPL